MFLRAAISKGEEVRYISHLDFSRTVERALRRACIPVAYSEGFNPHVKMSFGSALGLGIASKEEYFDVELTQDIEPDIFVERLASSLPKGITVSRASVISQNHKALMAVINFATYSAEMPLTGDFTEAQKAIDAFNHAATVSYTKHSPKGNRQIDLKQYISQPVRAEANGSIITLSFGIAITPTGSAKPGELLEVLSERFALPAQRELALIRREGLFIARGDDLVSPLDLRG